MKIGNKHYPHDSDVMTRPINTEKFGPYEVFTLTNDSAGHGIQVIPALGGKINKLWLNGHQVMDGYHNYDDLKNDTFYHNVFLFPFVNRLANGQYRFNYKDYQFTVNEPQTGNALHGFLFDEPFEIIEHSSDKDTSSIHLQCKYRSKYPYYPFDFNIDLWYRLYGTEEMKLEVHISNTGSSEAPVCWGWHPYFTFHHPVDDIELSFPSEKRILVDEKMLPTGKRKWDERYVNGKIIDNDKLDTCFQLKPEDLRSISLFSQTDQFKIDITPDHTFPYVHIFIPPDRQSIAIEPITSGINAFNTGDHLLRIKPGASYSGKIQVTITNT